MICPQGHLCQMTSRSWLVTHLSFCGCPPDSTWHDLMLLMVVGTWLMGQLVLALLHLFEQCSDTHQRESEQLSRHTLCFLRMDSENQRDTHQRESEQLSRHTLCFLRMDSEKTLNYSVHIIEIIICNEILIPFHSSWLHNLYHLPLTILSDYHHLNP